MRITFVLTITKAESIQAKSYLRFAEIVVFAVYCIGIGVAIFLEGISIVLPLLGGPVLLVLFLEVIQPHVPVARQYKSSGLGNEESSLLHAG